MKQNKLFIDIHAIQSIPPSNINRDDTGSPKTAQYGGVTRARVSSQSWKRAIRKYFHENSGEKNVGIRSLDIINYVANKIVKLDSQISQEEAQKRSEKIFKEIGIKYTKDFKLKALFFLGEYQADALAKMGLEENYDKEQLKAVLKDNPAVDIALFGRMVADDSYLNEDASSQVAHAISTHAVQTEFDFFTAVDELLPEDESGAGMLGTVEFNSSTLYRYANVALHDFLEQVKNKENAVNAIKLYVESFVKSLPTGKVNTFANQSLPKGLVISVRKDRPINMVTAFETPIRSKEGYSSKSIIALGKEFKKVEKMVEKPVLSLYLTLDDIDNSNIEYLGEKQETLHDLLETLSVNLNNLLD